MLALALLACQDPPHHRPSPAPTAPTEVATRDGWPVLPDLDALAANVMPDAQVPGMSAAIVKGGDVVWASAYGVADEQTGRPVSIDSPFMLASISKTVTATALMQVWETGAFDLDDDVNDALDYSVRYPALPEVPVTYRELFTHTSSVRDNWAVLDRGYVEGDSDVPLQQFLRDYLDPAGANYHAGLSYYGFPPGDHYRYSNVGATLLGGLVEVHTGRAFDRWCDDHVLGPLGMDHTGWFLADVDAALVARPHVWKKDHYDVVPNYGFPDYPDGQLRSTAADLGRFLAMFGAGGSYRGTRILDPDTVAEMKRVQFPDVEPTQGLIWYYVDYGGTHLIGHNGSDTGVATDMYIGEDGAGYVLLMNAEPRDWYSVEALEYQLLQAAEDWPAEVR